MRKSILIAISLLLAVMFAFVGCSKPAAPKTGGTDSDQRSDSAFLTEHREYAVIVPDNSSEYESVLWQLNMERFHFAYPRQGINTAGVLEKDDPRDDIADKIGKIAGEYWMNLTGKPNEYPDWYGGSYITFWPGYGIDTPYRGDGDSAPYKYCLLIVDGMESEAEELKELLKEYEDHIIYQTVKHSYGQREEFLNSILIPALKELGARTTSWSPFLTIDAVECYITEEYFTEEVFSLVKKLANEHGQNIVISVGGELIFD